MFIDLEFKDIYCCIMWRCFIADVCYLMDRSTADSYFAPASLTLMFWAAFVRDKIISSRGIKGLMESLKMYAVYGSFLSFILFEVISA